MNGLATHNEFRRKYIEMRQNSTPSDILKPIFEQVNPQKDDRVKIETIEGVERVVIRSRIE